MAEGTIVLMKLYNSISDNNIICISLLHCSRRNKQRIWLERKMSTISVGSSTSFSQRRSFNFCFGLIIIVTSSRRDCAMRKCHVKQAETASERYGKEMENLIVPAHKLAGNQIDIARSTSGEKVSRAVSTISLP